MTTSVLLVEDHPMFRRGLRRLLEEGGYFTVVAEALNAHSAIHLSDIHRPDLTLIDVQLPGVTGLRLAKVLRKQHERGRLVIVSMHLDDSRLLEAIRAGASAYLTKDTDPNVMLDTLHRVVAGENPLHHMVLTRPRLAWRVLAEFRQLADTDHDERADGGQAPLSAREVEVLDCVVLGLTNREIAAALFVTEQTVKNHMTSILRKLDANDRVQAVLFAVKHGWIEIGPSPYAPTVTRIAPRSTEELLAAVP